MSVTQNAINLNIIGVTFTRKAAIEKCVLKSIHLRRFIDEVKLNDIKCCVGKGVKSGFYFESIDQ